MKTAAYYADISPLGDKTLFDRYFAASPEERQKKISTLKRPEDRQLSLGVWVLLQRALDTSGVTMFSARFSYTPHGKPYVAEFPVRFNFSHSGGFVAVAISDSEVGIDIEKTEPQSRRLAERFFHPDEYAYVIKGGAAEFDCRFTEIWTRKEAYVKLLGKGIDSSFPLFSSLADIPSAKISTFRLDDGYFLSVAGEPCSSARELSLI